MKDVMVNISGSGTQGGTLYLEYLTMHCLWLFDGDHLDGIHGHGKQMLPQW